MFIYALCCSLVLGFNLESKLTSNQLQEEFDHFIIKYHKNYYSPEEYNYRFNIFKNNYNYMMIQNQQDYTYQLGINKFMDLNQTEYKHYKGYNGNHQPTLNNYKKYEYHTPPMAYVDWRAEGYVTDIKDQQQCGSCWAFSAIVALESAYVQKTGNLTSLSEQDLVDCVTGCDGCDGGWPSVAIEYTINSTQKGIDSELSYPYVGYDESCSYNSSNVVGKVHNLVKIPQGSVDLLINAVLTQGPISVAIDASDPNFMMYQSGIYQLGDCDPDSLDHAVAVVGYGIDINGHRYYIVKNSWGTDWGMDGYIYFSADTPNMCGIAQDACFAN